MGSVITITLLPALTLTFGLLLAEVNERDLQRVTTRINNLRPECVSPPLCPWYSRRPTLEDGRPSNAPFDVAREHLSASLLASALDPKHLPHASVVLDTRHPRVVVLDDVLEGKDISSLLAEVHDSFKDTSDETCGGIETAIVDHESTDEALNGKLGALLYVMGFPDRSMAELVRVNRFKATSMCNFHHDFLLEGSLSDNTSFSGCQRVATAHIYLNDIFKGGEVVFLNNSFMASQIPDVASFDLSSRATTVIRPKKGRMVYWYNVHPLTERLDKNSIHAFMPVSAGEKLVMTLHIRNCSSIENERRLHLLNDLFRNIHISTTVAPVPRKDSSHFDDDFFEDNFTGAADEYDEDDDGDDDFDDYDDDDDLDDEDDDLDDEDEDLEAHVAERLKKLQGKLGDIDHQEGEHEAKHSEVFDDGDDGTCEDDDDDEEVGEKEYRNYYEDKDEVDFEDDDDSDDGDEGDDGDDYDDYGDDDYGDDDDDYDNYGNSADEKAGSSPSHIRESQEKSTQRSVKPLKLDPMLVDELKKFVWENAHMDPTVMEKATVEDVEDERLAAALLQVVREARIEIGAAKERKEA